MSPPCLSSLLLTFATVAAAGTDVCSGDSCTGASVLLQQTSSVQRLEPGAICAPFANWPDVDDKVTCDSCTALVLVEKHGGRCDRYCESFGHVCVGAAEERRESCDVLESKRCDEVVAGTPDMLCTCVQPTTTPTPAPPMPTRPPVPSPPASPVEIKVASYNIYWLNVFLQEPWKVDHVVRNIKESLQADSLGLQECEDPGRVERRTGLLPASQFKGAQGVVVRPEIFSVGDAGARELQGGARFVTWAQLTHKPSGRVMWHFNTHMCAWNFGAHRCEPGTPQEREAAARSMLQVLREKAGDAPAIITGDFVAGLGEPGPQHLLRNGFSLAIDHGVDAILYSSAHWQKTWASTGPGAPSDHLSVAAKLRLK